MLLRSRLTADQGTKTMEGQTFVQLWAYFVSRILAYIIKNPINIVSEFQICHHVSGISYEKVIKRDHSFSLKFF